MATVPCYNKSDIRKQYDQDGYVIFRNVLDSALVAAAYEHVDWLMAQNPGIRPEKLGHDLAVKDPFWVRLFSDDRLVDLAEIFLGSDLAMFAAHYICKPPKTGQPVLWHQDGAYWPLDPMEVTTLWLAVSESTPENGGMRVIPGTHKQTLKKLRQRDDIDNVLASEMDGEVDSRDAVDIVLQPGDVSVHHPNIVHGSDANASERWRRGLTLRYIPTHVRVTEPQHPGIFLVRGAAAPGVDNVYLPSPSYPQGCEVPSSLLQCLK